ncbi:MAG: prohibitin family protein [Sulfurovaceae bacterium]|nr:prohibitin family protein [Sulfurovaceae bacterium]
MPADMNDYFKKKKSEPSNNTNKNNNSGFNLPQNPFWDGGKIPSWAIALGVLLILLLLFRPFAVINSGEVGIKVTLGKFNTEPLDPGLHFYIPIFEQIIPVNTKIRLITYSDKETSSVGENMNAKYGSSADGFEGGVKVNPSIQVLDKRGLTVNIDIAVQYQLKAATAPETIENWGSSWEEKIINSKVREVVRDVIGQYTAEQLPEMRNEIAKSIQTQITAKIDAIKGAPVVISSVELRNIDLPSKIKDQIERVQIAKQEVTIAEQQKEKAKQLADKITIEAQAQANANKVISSSLSPQLVQMEQIKVQGKFNDALRENKNAQIFLTPGGAVPNIWIDMKSNKQQISTQK